jgi:hypothetical protein
MVFTQQYMLQTIATDNFNQVGAVVYVWLRDPPTDTRQHRLAPS